MAVRLTKEEVEKRSTEKGLILLVYISTKVKAHFKCRCGKEFWTMPGIVFRGGAVSCGCYRKNYTRLTQEEAEKRFEERGLKLVGRFASTVQKVLLRCHCDKEFWAAPYNVFHGGVSSCGCHKRHNMTTQEEAEKRFKKRGLKLISKYSGRYIKVLAKCHCDKEFWALPDNVFSGSSRSCGCLGSSNGEAFIQKCLSKYSCMYIKEWTREATRKRGSLRYDFYLPMHHAIIEFNGRQHSKPVYFGTALALEERNKKAGENFAKLQARDKEKREWAAANGIPLLDINYDEIDQIEEKVWNFLMILHSRKEQQLA